MNRNTPRIELSPHFWGHLILPWFVKADLVGYAYNLKAALVGFAPVLAAISSEMLG